jgi:hypothetical protein
MDGMTAGRAVPAAGQLVCVEGEAVLVATGTCPLGAGVAVEPGVLVLQALTSTKQLHMNKRKR